MIFGPSFSPVNIPDVSLYQLMTQGMSQHGDKIAMINGATDRSFTFHELLDEARSVASGLARRGAKRGDTLAIYIFNCPEYIVFELAAWRLGMVVTTANPVYTAYELSKQLVDSDANYIIAEEENCHKAKRAALGNPLIKEIFVMGRAPGCTSAEVLLADDSSQAPAHVTGDPQNDVAILPYSSGTTGVPKGVMLTHRNIVANIMQMAHPDLAYDVVPSRRHPDLAPEDRPQDFTAVLLAFLPYYHMYGGICVLLMGLLGGARQVTVTRFQPENFLGCIQKYRVTSLSLVPPVVVFLTKSPLVKKYDLSSVISAGCGGAPLKKVTQQELVKMFNLPRVTQGYGLTETSPCLTAHPAASVKSGSVGKIVANTEFQIVDVETGKALGPEERGEIWARGPQIMKGYLKRPDANDEVFRPGGWFRTGDIGIVDKDGYVQIVDRMKELIKYKGFQVAPAELEELLLNHPRVADVGVVGVPDEEAGELPRAYVVKQDPHLTERDLHQHIDENVSHYKRLRGGIVFVDQVPKSQTGKILRRELREMIKKQSKL